MSDNRVGQVILVFKASPEHGMFQEFNSLTIADEAVSGLYESIPSGEVRSFSHQLNEIKSLEVLLFADR